MPTFKFQTMIPLPMKSRIQGRVIITVITNLIIAIIAQDNVIISVIVKNIKVIEFG